MWLPNILFNQTNIHQSYTKIMLLIVVNVAQINCHALMGNMKIVSREFLELMICVRTIHVMNEQGYAT